jgi:hypothetical protein
LQTHSNPSSFLYNDKIIQRPDLAVSVVINGSYPKTGALEGAEQLLPHLDAHALVINNFLVHPVLFIEWCSDYIAKLATATA